MMEIAMVITLAIMGIYFFKSTDLPKELTERSAQLRRESDLNTIPSKARPKFKIAINHHQNQLLENRQEEIKLLTLEKNGLSAEIIALELELKNNIKRNSEIQTSVDAKTVIIEQIREKINALA